MCPEIKPTPSLLLLYSRKLDSAGRKPFKGFISAAGSAIFFSQLAASRWLRPRKASRIDPRSMARSSENSTVLVAAATAALPLTKLFKGTRARVPRLFLISSEGLSASCGVLKIRGK